MKRFPGGQLQGPKPDGLQVHVQELLQKARWRLFSKQSHFTSMMWPVATVVSSKRNIAIASPQVLHKLEIR